MMARGRGLRLLVLGLALLGLLTCPSLAGLLPTGVRRSDRSIGLPPTGVEVTDASLAGLQSVGAHKSAKTHLAGAPEAG